MEFVKRWPVAGAGAGGKNKKVPKSREQMFHKEPFAIIIIIIILMIMINIIIINMILIIIMARHRC